MVEEGHWRNGFVEGYAKKETQHLGDLRVLASYTVSPNRDEVNDHRNKYMVPDDDGESDSKTNFIRCHEKDFLSCVQEGGEHGPCLARLREKVEARQVGSSLAGGIALAWKKRATAKAKGEDDGGDDAALRVPLIKSEEVQKIKGQMAVGGGEDQRSSQVARNSFLPRMTERLGSRKIVAKEIQGKIVNALQRQVFQRCSTGGSWDKGKSSFALPGSSKARRSTRVNTQPPTPVFDAVLSLPTKDYGSLRYPKSPKGTKTA